MAASTTPKNSTTLTDVAAKRRAPSACTAPHSSIARKRVVYRARYEKHAANYLALVKLESTRIWLRAYESVS